MTRERSVIDPRLSFTPFTAEQLAKMRHDCDGAEDTEFLDVGEVYTLLEQLAAEKARRELAEVLARNAEKDAKADRVALVLAYSRAEDAEARVAELEEAARCVVTLVEDVIADERTRHDIRTTGTMLGNSVLDILRPLPAPVEVANG